MASPASIRPLVAGNWKMNGLAAALGEARKVRDRLGEADYAAADVMICPPATLVALLAKDAPEIHDRIDRMRSDGRLRVDAARLFSSLPVFPAD